MFGDIPKENIHSHDWKNSCKLIGEISKDFVQIATAGKADWPIPIEINRAVVEGNYDLIVNIGQVVPHEVLGFANHNKNYFIGLGGKRTITASHMMAALCGIENNLAQIITPLRGCFNMAESEFLNQVPDVYVLIVKTQNETGDLITTGLYVGDDIDTYVQAARYARKNTVHLFDKPIKKVVCLMDGKEFNSTWVANKAVYRTRKVIENGGDLLILAPGVERFGEQDEVDQLIRKYGYKGMEYIMKAYRNDPELHDLGHAAAHLIHGSTENRFNITYAPGKLSREEVEEVGYQFLDLNKALEKYNPEKLKYGFNFIDGEEIFFIPSPSLGLWTSKEKFIEAINNNNCYIDTMIKKYPKEEMWLKIKSWNKEDFRIFE
jgi:nickel-dependent lactate racemase